MAQKWPNDADSHGDSNVSLSVIKQEVETFRLLQEDQLTDISEHNNSTALQEGVSIGKVYWLEQEVHCYRLEIGDHKVCRRQDTHFINASKLIKLSSITRGRRDAILRAEKVKYTVRKDQIDFRGVWVPFERARYLAVLVGIYDQVQDLFSYDMECVYQMQAVDGEGEALE